MDSIRKTARKFLRDLESSRSKGTHGWYARFLETLIVFAGEQPLDWLTPARANEWLGKYYGELSASTQHGAGRAITRLCNWATEERIIAVSPLMHFRKPAPSHRETLLTPAQYALCLRVASEPVRDVVKFTWHVGARPQEVRSIEKAWVNCVKILYPCTESKGSRTRKRRRRVIYLDDFARRLVVRLSGRWPTGPIFRNSHGQPWSKDSLDRAFRRLREKTGIAGLVPYSARHSWITRMLERGVDVATVAALAGNSPRTVLEVYSHVTANEERLTSIVRQAG